MPSNNGSDLCCDGCVLRLMVISIPPSSPKLAKLPPRRASPDWALAEISKHAIRACNCSSDRALLLAAYGRG